MRIDRICQRCRREYDIIEVHGGESGTGPVLPSMTGLTRPGICACGGLVYALTDGQVLPREYRLTPSRLTGAVVLSAGTWFVFFCLGAIAVVAPPKMQLDDEEKQTLAGKALGFTLGLGLSGTALGLVIFLTAAVLAARRGDVNAPHAADMLPPGQAALLPPAVGIGLCVGLLSVWQLAPLLAPQGLGLRAEGLRVTVGGVLGLFAAFLSHLALFKVCRSPRQ